MLLLELSSLLSKVPVWAGLLPPPPLDHNSLLQGEATRGQVSILPKLISLARGCRQSHCTQFLHLTLHKSNSQPHVVGLRIGVNQSPDHQKGCEWGWLPQEHFMLISFPNVQSLWRQTIVISPSGETWQWKTESKREETTCPGFQGLAGLRIPRRPGRCCDFKILPLLRLGWWGQI